MTSISARFICTNYHKMDEYTKRTMGIGMTYHFSSLQTRDEPLEVLRLVIIRPVAQSDPCGIALRRESVCEGDSMVVLVEFPCRAARRAVKTVEERLGRMYVLEHDGQRDCRIQVETECVPLRLR